MSDNMIDAAGYRSNVGIIIANGKGQLFWAKRIGQNAWQFPQGGVGAGESLEDALFRELHEEVGLRPEHVTLVAKTKEWLHYDLPKRYQRAESKPLCIGQKQKWFLLYLQAHPSEVSFTQGDKAEFDGWRWVSYWYPLHEVVSFKAEVYRQALAEFAPYVMGGFQEAWQAS